MFAEKLDDADVTFDSTRACNTTFPSSKASQDDPYDLSRKIGRCRCTMWQAIKSPKGFAEQLRSVQRNLGRKPKDFPPLFHRNQIAPDPQTKLVVMSCLGSSAVIEILLLTFPRCFLN